MKFDLEEIAAYYDSAPSKYDYYELLEFGISLRNADFIVSIGLPQSLDDFVFYELENMQKEIIKGVKLIRIGHHATYGFLNQQPLYLLEGEDEMFFASCNHPLSIYQLNKDLKTFFLFHLMRYELYSAMKKAEKYNTHTYAYELRQLFIQYDANTMEDTEGYWSHLIEDYETGL